VGEVNEMMGRLKDVGVGTMVYCMLGSGEDDEKWREDEGGEFCRWVDRLSVVA
jgi:hypothetical protein